MEFLNAETHTPVLLMNHLQSLCVREVWIWVNTVYLPEDQNYKGPVQKTHWRSRTSCRKFWWFDYSRSQSSQWRKWISKRSSICSRGAGLGHPMDPVVSVQNKNFSGPGELEKFLEPNRKHQVIYTDNSLEFGKACEDLSWNHCTSTPHRSETNGIAERAVRRVKEGTSAVSLQSGLDEKWWADSVECKTYLRNIQDLLSDGKTPYERRFGEPFNGPIIPFGSLGWVLPYFCEGPVKNPSIWKKVLPQLFRGSALYAGWIWKGEILVADIEELETMDASETYSERLNAKEVIFAKENGNFIFQPQMDESHFLEEIRNWEHRPWNGNTQFEEKVTEIFLESQKGLFYHLKTHFRMPWSDKWFLVHVRKLQKPPSRWTKSQTLLAERRIFPYSTEIHWRIQNYKNEFGC